MQGHLDFAISNCKSLLFHGQLVDELCSSTKMQSNLTVGNPLSLDRIRSVLVRLEDTIIFSLIERAQFVHNARMYQRGAFKELQDIGFNGSWLEWFLKETETFHGEHLCYQKGLQSLIIIDLSAKARRYTRSVSPCSHHSIRYPFSLQPRRIPLLKRPAGTHYTTPILPTNPIPE